MDLNKNKKHGLYCTNKSFQKLEERQKVLFLAHQNKFTPEMAKKKYRLAKNELMSL